MKHNIKTTLSVIAVATLLSAPFCSCSNEVDDSWETMKRLFTPVMTQADVEGNTIKYFWNPSEGATGYVIELSVDSFQTAPIYRFELEPRSTYRVTNLHFSTTYQSRIMALCSDQTKDSKWGDGMEKITEARKVPIILQDPADSDYNDTQATLRWEISDANPVDSIAIVPALDGNDNAVIITTLLTDAEIAAGVYVAKGLTPNTLYRATIYNSKNEVPAERNYNSVTFRTEVSQNIPTTNVIILKPDDNLVTTLSGAMTDPEILDGVTIVLPEGSTYYMCDTEANEAGTLVPIFKDDGKVYGRAITYTKGVKFLGLGKKKPVICYYGDKNQISGHISALSYNNIELRGVSRPSPTAPINGGLYLFNTSNEFAVDELSITNCTCYTIAGFFYLGGTNSQVISKITIDNSIVSAYTSEEMSASGAVGLFHNDKGKDILGNMTITNSTFMNVPRYRGFFHNSTVKTPVNLTVEHCTFFNFSTNNAVDATYNPIAGQGFIVFNIAHDQSTDNAQVVTFRNNVFSSPIKGSIIKMSQSALYTWEDNYITTEVGTLTNFPPVELKSVGMSMFELYKGATFDPATCNLEVTAKTSDVYLKRLGDPRWLD